jgi:uncharacterized phage protein gp47/JayE
MPFGRPTLTQLRSSAIQDITTSGVPGLAGLLRNAVLRVMAWPMSGLAYSVYGYIDWCFRQSIPFTATDEYLAAWAGLIGVYQKGPKAATGSATFYGTPGSTAFVLPSGAALTRQDGTPYTTTADGASGADGTVTVPIVAAVLGALTNDAGGTPINIDDPIPGINSGGVMAGPATGGTDQETADEFRSRMLFGYRNPPQGGASGDYVRWALEVPGVTRAWVGAPYPGPGSVVVFPMLDDANAPTGGFPVGSNGVATGERRGTTATGDQLTIANYLFTPQPVTALVTVAAPVPFPIDVTLATLNPNTETMRAAITAALDDLMLSVAAPGGVIYPSDIYGAILAAPGIISCAVASPVAAVHAPPGHLPIMGALT